MWTNTEKLLALSLLPKSARGTYWALREAYGSHEALLSALFCSPNARELDGFLHKDAISLLIGGQTRSPLVDMVAAEMARVRELGVTIVSLVDSTYPPLLAEISRPPPLLYVLGDPICLSLPQIAMVGSRTPTPLGRELARDFASELGRGGFAITSGLALGIDGDAHRGALQAGAKTIAVLGSGLANIYPRRHLRLAEDIIEHGGALVSEFPLGLGALRQNFPQRNRIVSGLSVGTLVVEAAIKSGSLITARYALQQDREVFAIPGSIRSPVSKGCHSIIKSGAKLVENVADVTSELTHMLDFHQQELFSAPASAPAPKANVSAYEMVVLDALGFELNTIDVIAKRLNKNPAECAEVLLQLELLGHIENTGLGYVRK